MVEEIKGKNKKYYACEVCGFVYDNKQIAEKCEDWCSKHNTCSLEITRFALYRSRQDIK
ncbi:MAG: hypothetical protein QW156_03660 [Candidatus Aenigmatarchaeota archaeon]